MNKETFKAIRQYLQLSQIEYAKELGVASSTVSMIESGHRRITERVTGKVAFLDVDIDEVYRYIEKMNNLSNG